jgi:hypothetical protein
MSKPQTPNGKTRTHFEQIPVSVVERIAITDVSDPSDIDRRAVDRGGEPAALYDPRRPADRRKSSAGLVSPAVKES